MNRAFGITAFRLPGGKSQSAPYEPSHSHA